MRRFTKVALLLAAMSVLACSAAFAAPLNKPYHAGDLVGNTDARLLVSVSVSDDLEFGHKSFDTIVSPDHKLDGKAFLTFNADIVNGNITLKNAFGDYINPGFVGRSDSKIYGKSFDKLLVRTTVDTFTMNFNVTNSGVSKDVTFGLRSGFEKDTTLLQKGSYDLLAEGCTLTCENFWHSGNYTDPIASGDSKKFKDIVEWKGVNDKKRFYVECCDHLGFVAVDSANKKASTSHLTRSMDMVVAHLSTTPFIRVRVASAGQVLPKKYNYVTSKDIITSKDFRADYWKHDNLQTKPVDVPDGKTFNLGVLYTDSSDCKVCGTPTCDNGYLPVVAVTNLGNKAVDIIANYGETGANFGVAPWLCNSWCGLCEFDDMMSGDKGSLQDKFFFKKDDNEAKVQSALGDCICHIYPAFTNTFKGKGNEDINWTGKSASATTTIAGRVNTSWAKEDLSTGGFCTSCEESAYFYFPCNCLEIYYVNTIGTELRFARSGDLKIVSYNEDNSTVAGDYSRRDMVLGLEDKKSADILLTKLTWELDEGALSDAGLLNLSGGEQWWRSELWNNMGIKLNGIPLDGSNVVSTASADTFSASELGFLTIVDGPQAPAPEFKLGATDKATVTLFVFVMDSDENAVRYYKDTDTKNQYLVVYDGEKNGEFKLEGVVYKKSGGDVPTVFGVSASDLDLNIAVSADKAKTLSAKNTDGKVVLWEVLSSDIATLSATSGDSVTVTGVAVGTTTVHASISGDADVSADCTITVKDEAPAPVGDSSGGGCNVGFAPAMLLLLAPLGFLKK